MPLPSSVLIVEDEEILADNLKTYLGRRGFDARVAPDAETAIQMLEFFAPRLVVLDYALPGIDGLRAYGEIVRASRQAPSCIMISGHMTSLLSASAQSQGINHILCKPFSFAEFQNVIDSA